MIPEGQYDPRRLATLVSKLRVELSEVKSGRKEMEARWTENMRAYEARPREATKSFPFPGCANIVVPVVAIDVDKIYSWMMSLLFGQDNLWVAKATRPDMADVVPRIQEFMQWAQNNELDAYNQVADWCKEFCLLGTGILKTRYMREVRRIYEFREQQTEAPGMPMQIFERNARIALHDHPTIEHVPLWDFYVHSQATTISDAPWVAQYVPLSFSEYEERVKAGIYLEEGKLAASWARSLGSDLTRQLETWEGFRTTRGDKLDLFEFWLRADLTGSGEMDAIVVTIHESTGIAVRVDYNPFFNQEPPFDKACFVRKPKRFYGVGLGDMLATGQEEVSAIHNQRLDSSTVRMMPVFKAMKGGNISVDEPIWPGRILHVDNMEDFGSVALASGAWESTANDEQLILAYLKERSGVNDFVTGGDGSDVAYAAATTALNQMREGKKRFDQSMREIRQCLAGVGTKVLELYQQFNQAGKPYVVMGEEDGAIMQKVLNFPLDIIRASVTVDIAATSAALNKEVEVRTNTLLMQLLQQHNGMVNQTMMQLLNPQLPPPLAMVLQQQLVSSSLLMRRIFESYGQQDVDELVMNFSKMFGGASGGNGAGPGGGVPPAAIGQPSMGILPPGVGQQAQGVPQDLAAV